MPYRHFENFSWNRDPEIKVLKEVARELKTMTGEEFTASLIDAGILTKSGKRLTKPYRELYEEDMAIIAAAEARQPTTHCECGRPLPDRRAPPAPVQEAAKPVAARASRPKRKAMGTRRKATVSPRRSTPARPKRRP